MFADNIDQIAKIEHLATSSQLSLLDFCHRLREILGLPKFSFDRVNMTEWGLVIFDDIEYNVSRPYVVGTLWDWDDTVPEGCTMGISLTFFREHPAAEDDKWTDAHILTPIGDALAREFSVPVYHHRTWRGPGKNIRRTRVFSPLGGF
jgi:hypothetical protein